jgi:hypothetical protein
VGSLDSAEAIEEFPADVAEVVHLEDVDGVLWKQFGVTEQSSFVLLDAEARWSSRPGTAAPVTSTAGSTTSSADPSSESQVAGTWDSYRRLIQHLLHGLLGAFSRSVATGRRSVASLVSLSGCT